MSISDVFQLAKVRLSLSVVFSAIAGYFIAGGSFSSFSLFYLVLGGFLVVACSNGLNQLLEKDLDSLMKRTENRPLPTRRMKSRQNRIYRSFLELRPSLLDKTFPFHKKQACPTLLFSLVVFVQISEQFHLF